MKLGLEGKVKFLEATIGTIDCKEYNEVYYFLKSDIVESDRWKIKKGDTVLFQLKQNKNKKSKAFRVSLLSKKKKKINTIKTFFREKNNNRLVNSIQDKENKFKLVPINKTLVQIKSEFRVFGTENFTDLTNKSELSSDLIKLVVKDNIITDIEKKFIDEKINELDLSKELAENIKDYTFSNNPFFDNILSIIFKDGIVKEIELEFLFEKSNENSFSKSFVNNRFWQYAIKYHLDDLTRNEDFIKIIKLWFTCKNLKIEVSKDWLILRLNIYDSNNLKVSVSKALRDFEQKIEDHLKKEFSLSDYDFSNIYKSFNDTQKHETKVSLQPTSLKTKQENLVDINTLRSFRNKFEENPFTAYSEFKNHLHKNLNIKNIKTIKSLWDEVLNL